MIGRWSGITSAAVAALGALVCACSNPGGSTASASSSTATAQPGPWRVGAYLSLSGSDAQYGIDTKEGIELAVEEVNRAGGVKGQPIRVFYEDDKSNPQEATNKVLELIDRDKVIALLGEVTSARSKAGGIVANKKKIPMITTSTNAEVTKVGPYIFRNCFTDEAQGKWGAEFIVKSLGKKKIAVMFASDDLYSSGLAQEFRTHVKSLGAEIVIEKSFGKIETNFTTYLNEIKERHPEVIYAPVYYSVMVPIARQASAVGIKGSMLVGGDGWDADELLQDAGQEMEGAYFTNHYAPDVPWESSRLFVESYKVRFKHAPSGAAAQGYDAARMLFDAMGRTKGDTSDELREAIQDTKDFQGATGVITIDPERNANKSVVIVQIKGKSFKFYASLNDRQRAPASPSASAAAPQPAPK
jgi:branched-chain amino acid transport system substrate-binding protein